MPADPTPCGPLDWSREGATWPNRGTSRFVEAAGLVWHVQVAGSGPVALLIHGTGASTHSWRDLMPLLARRFTVVAPDLPGHAFTQRGAANRTSLPGMAAGVAALMARLGLTPSIVVGHSAGAAVLVRLCLDRVIRPEGIVSLNGALLPIGGVAGQVFSPLARMLASSSMASRLFARHAAERGVVQRMIAQTGSRLDAVGLDFYTRLARNPMHTAGALAMMAGWDLMGLERELPRLTVPLVLAVGGRDQTIKPDDALKVRDLVPGSTIEYLRGLGHLAHEEKPALIADLIERYASSWGVADDVGSNQTGRTA